MTRRMSPTFIDLTADSIPDMTYISSDGSNEKIFGYFTFKLLM